MSSYLDTKCPDTNSDLKVRETSDLFSVYIFVTINTFWRITAVYVKSNMKAVKQV